MIINLAPSFKIIGSVACHPFPYMNLLYKYDAYVT